MRVAIIGAGLTGLTAASLLRDAGVEITVFDKSRGLGGRLSTRRTRSGFQFDHGAQYLSGTDAGYQAFLATLVEHGAAMPWASDEAQQRIVGLPGMSGIAKHLAKGIDVTTEVEISTLQKTDPGWVVEGEIFDRVICTVPAPQAQRLVPDAQMKAQLGAVTMDPNLTLMVAFSQDVKAPFNTRRDADQDIAWLALDSSKPDRTTVQNLAAQNLAAQSVTGQTWVAQASLAWSQAHLELEKDEIATRMLPLVCQALNADPNDALYVAAHRWRYAFASAPLGQAFIASDGLYVGGDWALSHQAEGAWLSGRAMAQAVLS